jgi:hypothetical protein
MSESGPALPSPRGPLSEGLISQLGGEVAPLPSGSVHTVDDALADDDLQLALYCAYELHYRSFDGVPEEAEWDPALIAFRGELERAFESALRAAVPADPARPGSVGDRLFELAADDDGPSLSRALEAGGTLEQFREFVIHRSAYQLKEADPHTWAIPRLEGAPKAAMVEIQSDEYGSGRPERVHSALFAQSMRALGLDDAYGAYLERLPGATLATVNLISMLGLNRRLRGALVGHLAMFEITSPQPNRRYGAALRRLGFGLDATDFYDEHVIADSVHENVAAYDLAQGLASAEPALAADIAWGARCLLELDARWAARVLEPWSAGRSSLLPEGDRAGALA